MRAIQLVRVLASRRALDHVIFIAHLAVEALRIRHTALPRVMLQLKNNYIGVINYVI